jgi:hypothetical protein
MAIEVTQASNATMNRTTRIFFIFLLVVKKGQIFTEATAHAAPLERWYGYLEKFPCRKPTGELKEECTEESNPCS